MNTFLTVNAWLAALILSSTMAARPTEESRVFVSQDHGLTWNRGDHGFPDDDGINVLILHNKRVFAGTNGHGIWAMDQNGWYIQSSGLPKESRVISLLSNNQVLFAGLDRGGLYYSADEGSSWHPVGQRPDDNVRALSGRAGEVYAGTDDGIYRVNVRDGTWQRLLGGVQINAFACNDRYIYASTHQGVVRSTDGLAWEPVYRRSAINKVVLIKSEILLMDYSGNVYRADQEHPFFIKEDLFLPHHYFKLTPASPKIMGGEWSELSFVKSGARKGLPASAPLSILLQTPFGLLAVRSPRGGGC
ncbi:MAG TPA: hypothetical protein VK658_15820 [Chryseolinea sp.]|nr:hypothetical protein [Chryseolinea sp.]